MGLLTKLFRKKITVNEQDLNSYFCYKHRKSYKKVKLNTVCIVPDDCVCVFCYYKKPCDILKTGEYSLNGNSLPILYKKGGYNKPNRRNYIPDFFYANIWFVSLNNLWLEFDIDKFIVKDRVYGKQKIEFSFKVNIKVNDAQKFLKNLLYERPRITSRNVVNILISWFKNDIEKHLRRQGYIIDDYVCYTRGFNQELQNLLSDRFTSMGLDIVETILEDIQMSDELLRKISDNRDLSFKIHSSLKDFDIAMTNDGVNTSINFARSREQMQGSILENYNTKNQDYHPEMDIDYSNPIGYNQNASNYSTNRYEEIAEQIQQQEDLNNQIMRNNFFEMPNIEEQNQNENNQENNVNTNNFEDMYNMANDNFNEDAYTTLYGTSNAFKTCSNCGRQVPIYLSFCQYCGSGDFKHDL